MILTRRRFVCFTSLAIAAMYCDCRVVFAAHQRKPQRMDEQHFWSIIRAAKAGAGSDINARPDSLKRALFSLDLLTIQSFQEQYDSLIFRANRWDLWGAAYLMNGGCSDDGFLYFRAWLISEGREIFEAALFNPDSLARLQRQEQFDLESFGYVALEVFAAKGGGELARDFSNELTMPSGKEWSEKELPALFPQLAVKYLAK